LCLKLHQRWSPARSRPLHREKPRLPQTYHAIKILGLALGVGTLAGVAIARGKRA
ncbi:MAG: hypothetical protein HC824_20810, partial [Synechococcales cyanobacterium RM1_1_8]|nr:hypothetical protein [Synechococcales cyanobacterium RM1_1_8]